MSYPLLSFVAALTQFVGETCGPSGCTPIVARLPPAALPFVTSAYARCGELRVFVHLLNEERESVSSERVLPAKLFVGNSAITLQLRTSSAVEQIQPNKFTNLIKYTAEIPKEINGAAFLRLAWGNETLPAVQVDITGVTNCP